MASDTSKTEMMTRAQDPSIPIGKDMFTALPTEMLREVLGYLRPSDKDPWSGKDALIAVSSTFKTLRNTAVKDLFRHVTLRFTYTYDNEKGGWKVPRLVDMVESSLAAINDVDSGSQLKVHLKTVRLLVVPMRDGVRATERARLEYMASDIRERFNSMISIPIYSPCIERRARIPENAHLFRSDANTDPLTAQFHTLFGKANGDAANPVDVYVQHRLDVPKYKRQVFADYVLCKTQKVLNGLPNLRHLEPALWWHHDETYRGLNYGYFESKLMRRYATAFTTAIMCRLVLPLNFTTLKIRGMPLLTQPMYFRMAPTTCDMPHEVSHHCLHAIGVHLPRLSISELEIDVDTATEWPFDGLWMLPPNGWTSAMRFWADVLSNMQNLRRLRLNHTGDVERGRKPSQRIPLYLDEFLDNIILPQLETLRLDGWSATSGIVANKIARSFPGLRLLELVFVDIISDDVDPWPAALRTLEGRYGEIEVRVDGLRRRSVKATYGSDLKKRMEGEVGIMWDKLRPWKISRTVGK